MTDVTTNWTKPTHSRAQVRRAGASLRDPNLTVAEREEALSIANNWRSSHAFPLNTCQMSLRNKALDVDPTAIVAQRVKRLPSILGKLERFDSMSLDRMQDLGGCRAVMQDVNDVYEVRERFLESRHKHVLKGRKDCIEEPASSGYRGLHLVYQYRSDRMETWNGLLIEIQIRSALQHAWATAVETVGLFTSQALKSSQGDAEWLDFFRTMSSEIALREQAPVVPGTSTDRTALRSALRAHDESLDVLNRLGAYAATLQFTESEMKHARFILLTLNVREQQVTATGFRTQESATDAYAGEELLAAPGTDVVLVSVNSIAGLRNAYPNYFLDTARFTELLRDALGA